MDLSHDQLFVSLFWVSDYFCIPY